MRRAAVARQENRAEAPRRATRLTVVDASAVEVDAARQSLEQQIAVHLPQGQLALSLTDNRHTMISVKRQSGRFRLRLHHMFLSAEIEVVQALGHYVARNDRQASRLLGDFIDLHQRKIRPLRKRRRVKAVLESSGQIYDLAAIYHSLNERYFAQTIDARIAWGQRAPASARPRRRNSIKMGSYSVEERLIRIHPSLDRQFVPRVFVESIVYHEMLHQKHDIPVVGGRRRFHTAEFLAEEARFEHHLSAQKWERENLDRLLEY